ncbi:MAG: hypothetical protein QW757_02610 [Candidatus Woesearchaeota archaeon]
MNKKKAKLNKKLQLISMDFIMTFVIYLLSISIFFLGLKNLAFSENSNKIDINSELLFNKISQTYNEDIGFLKNSIINSESFDNFLNTDPQVLYDMIFNDLLIKTPAKIVYCVYLENKNKLIIKNKAIYSNFNPNIDYKSFIYFSENDNKPCGENPNYIYRNKPKCNLNEAILLKKPVLYNKDIHNLYVFVCAE